MKISDFLSENFQFLGCEIFNIYEHACFRNGSLNMAYMPILLLKKMWVAFAFAKVTHIFFSKKTSVN